MLQTHSFRSSGDVLADRRYEYASAAYAERDFVAAADLARQVLELAPGFAPAHAILGRSAAALGMREEAVQALARALELEPGDALGVRLDLARLGALPAEGAMTGTYVRALFDEYAPKFNRHLTGNLAYCGPELIVDALRRACSKLARDGRFGPTLDLGCGTGLMGQALEGRCASLVGVDLSPRMLAMAAKTTLYDALHEGELVSFLGTRTEAEADLVIAADVFVYMAALDEAFRETRRVLQRGGLFAFTAQAHEGEGFVLGNDARYAHSRSYLHKLAEENGLTVVIFENAAIREDHGVPVPGFLAVMQR